MGGAAKIGKTFLLLDLAHQLATGGTLWSTDYKIMMSIRVLYCEQEVGEAEFQRRVKLRYSALGLQPPEELYFTSRLKNFFLDTNEGQRVLAREIEETKAQVVIIDPIGRCLLGSENDNSEVGRLFHRFDELLVSYPGLSLVISHHFGKPPREDVDASYDTLSPYNFRGASKWFDAPDSLITFIKMQQRPGEWKRLRSRMELRQGESPEHSMDYVVLPGGIVKPTPQEKMKALQGAGSRDWK